MDHISENSAQGGHYELDLSSPYDRSLLRMLYKKCDAIGYGPCWGWSPTYNIQKTPRCDVFAMEASKKNYLFAKTHSQKAQCSNLFFI